MRGWCIRSPSWPSGTRQGSMPRPTRPNTRTPRSTPAGTSHSVPAGCPNSRRGMAGSLGTGFGAVADQYECGRAGYAPDAVGRLVEELGLGPGVPVLDLAAGTGKMTRQLAASGAAVVAVEP